MAIEVFSQQQDEETPSIWYAKIMGPHSGDGINRLADIAVNEPPADWIANNPVDAQAAIDAGVINDTFNAGIDFKALSDDVNAQLAWLAINIPLVDTADLATLRVYLKRTMQQMQAVLKALRYVFKKTIV